MLPRIPQSYLLQLRNIQVRGMLLLRRARMTPHAESRRVQALCLDARNRLLDRFINRGLPVPERYARAIHRLHTAANVYEERANRLL